MTSHPLPRVQRAGERVAKIVVQPFLFHYLKSNIFMEEEVPTDHLHEAIQEKAEHGKPWVMVVALSTAVIAVLAAICALLSGHHENEALIDQIKASDQWSYYQAKGIKYEINNAYLKTMAANKLAVTEEEKAKVERYKDEQTEIKKLADEKVADSEMHLKRHVILSRGVTLFQVAIAIAAISVLTRRKALWFVSLGAGLCGVFFLIQGII